MTTARAELPIDYQKAFKSADIRGVYPSEIDEELTYRVARAFVAKYKYKTVLVARDMRLSSPSLRDAFVAGVREQGADVIDLGLIGTPCLYFASGSMHLPGVMITASHNPKDYNGLKLVQPGGIPLTDTHGLDAIEKTIAKNKFKEPKKRGTLKHKKILTAYKRYLQKFTHIDAPRQLKIVVDAGNGMGTTLAPILENGLPIKITPLFFELDGTFPNRESNPTLKENQTAIVKKIKQVKPDFGVGFDGDVDRVAFFDEHGNYINSAVIGAVIAHHLLKQKPKDTFVYTNFTSRSYQDAITEGGGKAIRARVGHAFIKQLMRQKKAVFACEHSAHFYFRSNYYTDSGIITLLLIAEVAAAGLRAGQTFSELIKPFNKYFQTEEILVEVKNKDAALKKVTRHFPRPKKTDTFDGLFMMYDDVWFTVKRSVTEDALKFVVESKSKAQALTVQKEILAILKKS